MRLFLMASAALTLGLSACAPPASDPTAQFAADCADERLGEAQRVEACTTLLDTPDLEETLKVEALAHRGDVRRRNGQPTEALADFNSALALAPTQSQAQLGKAAILIESGQLDAATPLVEAVVERGELAAQAHYLRGNLRARWGDAAGAVQDYDAALTADPRMAAAFAQRGLVKQGYNDLAPARADFDSAIGIESENAPARAGRCWNRLYREEGPAPARADAEVAIRANPHLISGHLCLGMAALKQGEWGAARAAYEAAVALEPGNAEALYGRGIASIRQGNRREGNDDIDQAQQFNSLVENGFRRVGVRL